MEGLTKNEDGTASINDCSGLEYLSVSGSASWLCSQTAWSWHCSQINASSKLKYRKKRMKWFCYSVRQRASGVPFQHLIYNTIHSQGAEPSQGATPASCNQVIGRIKISSLEALASIWVHHRRCRAQPWVTQGKMQAFLKWLVKSWWYTASH